MDYSLFEFINNLAGKFFWLDTIGIFFASYFQYVLAAGTVLFMLVKKDKLARWRNFKITALAFFAAVVSRYILCQILKVLVARPRPPEAFKVTQLIPFDSFGSFPSGHMSFFFALSIVVFFYNRKASIILFAGSFLMGLARIFTGIHFPSDILGGMVLGVLVGWGSWRIFSKIV